MAVAFGIAITEGYCKLHTLCTSICMVATVQSPDLLNMITNEFLIEHDNKCIP